MTIGERVNFVRNQIACAAERSGRHSDDIVLVGVTKNHSADEARDVLLAGVRDLGENRVQEGVPKFASLSESFPGFRRHLIGHLQSNKAKLAVQSFDYIHSVESEKLAKSLEHYAGLIEKTVGIFLEVNISGEASKFGLNSVDVPPLVEFVLRDCPHLRLCGLMTMAPLEALPESTRPVFVGLRELSVRLQRDYPNFGSELSMGMSNDFEVAIEEGASHVRVGSALFSN